MRPGRLGSSGTNWQLRHKGLNEGCPAEHYVVSLHQPNPGDLELLLIHEESRKVMHTGHIDYYRQFYRVPDQYIGDGSGPS